jgi:DNA-binding NarL/FixJ family response regulator
MKKHNILLGDDHTLILIGLKDFLSTLDSVDTIRTASNATELFHELQQNSFDIIFLDIHFGMDDGRELAQKIAQQYPNITKVALTSFEDKDTIKSSINAGFKAYFLKSDPLQEIKKWLENENLDEIFLSSGTKSSYTDQEFYLDKTFKQSVVLTPREKEILYLLTEEYTTKKIAEKLFLSEKTIENYRSNLMIKLDVKNVVGLVKKTLLLGLLR